MRQIFKGNGKINIHKFDNSEFDLIAVYVGPSNKVVLIEAIKAKKRSLSIRT